MNERFLQWHAHPDADVIGSGLWVESAGHYVSRHHIRRRRVRDDYLLVLCVAGGGVFQLGRQPHTIGAGELFLAQPGVPHVYQADPVTGWDIWWTHFGGAVAERLAPWLGFSMARPVLAAGTAEPLRQAFEQLCTILRAAGRQRGLDASATLYPLLMQVRKSQRAQAISSQGLDAALAGNPRDVAAMARAVGMSKFHFARRFHAAVGVTPWQYVLRRRLQRARELLAGTDLMIKEIAIECGFNDPNYFSRLFQREYGCTARQFRARRM